MDNSKLTPNELKDTNELNEFFKSLNEKQRKAFEIAKKQLGSSFDIYRCNGFIDWKKKQTST
jgi:hypothetical protein